MSTARTKKRRYGDSPSLAGDEAGRTLIVSKRDGEIHVSDAANLVGETIFTLKNTTQPPESISYVCTEEFTLTFTDGAQRTPVHIDGIGVQLDRNQFQSFPLLPGLAMLRLQAIDEEGIGLLKPPGRRYPYRLGLPKSGLHVDPDMDIQC